MAQRDIKQATIRIGNVEIKLGEGSFTYDETKNREYVKNRGVLDTVRDGDEEPINVQFDCTWEYIMDSTGALSASTNEAYIKALLESETANDPCAPPYCDIEIEWNVDCGAGGGSSTFNQTVTLPEFRWEKLSFNVKEGTINVTGKCNATEALYS